METEGIEPGFSDQLEAALRWFGGISEGVCGFFHTETGQPWPWPTTDDVQNKGRLVGENVQLVETDIVFNQIVFNSWIFSSDIVLIPLALLEDSCYSRLKH